MWTDRQAIEVFHLLFLRAFGARVDTAFYVLKGGCNLRFFCKSIRYSEDIDLDVHTVATHTLQKHVDTLLSSPAFDRTLRAQRLAVTAINAPKQTQTTQRWKLQVRVDDIGRDVSTKIEFSLCQFHSQLAFDPVDAEIISRYRLYPVLVQHYTPTAAFIQKVEALALRTETQARDVFDLKLLLDSGTRLQPDDRPREILPRAIENAIGIGYDAFAGQVLAYLEPEYQRHYRSRNVWNALQDEVVRSLEALQP